MFLAAESRDVGELNIQAVGASSAVAEIHLPEAFGGDVAQLPLARPGFLRVEQAGGVLRWQGEGEVADTGVEGGAQRLPTQGPRLRRAHLRPHEELEDPA
jgi:hypothetical protein